MSDYQLSPPMAEDQLVAFLKSTEGTGWDVVNTYPMSSDQWQVLTSQSTNTVIRHYNYRLLPAVEEKQLPAVFKQIDTDGWLLFSLQPAPTAPGFWRVMARRDAGSQVGK